MSNLTNQELALIYDYLQGSISQTQLGKEMKRSRTNTYYYVGIAVRYWLERGVLNFAKIEKAEELGGKDIDDKEQ